MSIATVRAFSSVVMSLILKIYAQSWTDESFKRLLKYSSWNHCFHEHGQMSPAMMKHVLHSAVFLISKLTVTTPSFSPVTFFTFALWERVLSRSKENPFLMNSFSEAVGSLLEFKNSLLSLQKGQNWHCLTHLVHCGMKQAPSSVPCVQYGFGPFLECIFTRVSSAAVKIRGKRHGRLQFATRVHPATEQSGLYSWHGILMCDSKKNTTEVVCCSTQSTWCHPIPPQCTCPHVSIGYSCCQYPISVRLEMGSGHCYGSRHGADWWSNLGICVLSSLS